MTTRMAAIVVATMVATWSVVGPMMLLVALVVRARIAIAAAPANEAANDGSGNECACAAVSATSVSTTVMTAAMMTAASVVASMATSVMTTSVANLVNISFVAG